MIRPQLISSSSCSNEEVKASIKYASIKAREFVVVPLVVALFQREPKPIEERGRPTPPGCSHT